MKQGALKKLKSDIDKAQKDIREVEGLVSRMVSDKGFPETMQQWFQSRVKNFKDSHGQIHQFYVNEMTDMPSSPLGLEGVQARTQKVEEVIAELSKDFKDFKDGVMQDVKHLMAGSKSSK